MPYWNFEYTKTVIYTVVKVGGGTGQEVTHLINLQFFPVHLCISLYIIACGLSFHSANFKRHFLKGGVELVLGQAVGPAQKGHKFQFSRLSRGCIESPNVELFFCLFCEVEKSFGVGLQLLKRSLLV